MSNIFMLLQQRFFERLQDKTSWGRNDLKTLYLECQVEVLGDAIPQELTGVPTQQRPVGESTFMPKVVQEPSPTPESELISKPNSEGEDRDFTYNVPVVTLNPDDKSPF